MSLTLEQLEQKIVELEKVKAPSKADGWGLFSEPEVKEVGEFAQLGFLNRLKPTRADVPILVAGIGAASSTAVAEQVKDLLFKDKTEVGGFDVMTASRLLGGYVGYKLGGVAHPLVSSFFGGMLIDAVGDVAEQKGFYLKPKSTTTGRQRSHTTAQPSTTTTTGSSWVRAAARTF